MNEEMYFQIPFFHSCFCKVNHYLRSLWYSYHCWHVPTLGWMTFALYDIQDYQHHRKIVIKYLKQKTCFETCNIFSDAIKVSVVTSHQISFKTCFGIIQQVALATSLCIIQCFSSKKLLAYSATYNIWHVCHMEFVSV